MSDFTKIADLMRTDWDRRISHDYRFWMSDGRTDDQVMWESGRRDFDVLCRGLDDTAEQTLLEIGCGVGRLLRTGLERFQRVVGIDVSEQAILKARELLPDTAKLELLLGSGYDLKGISDHSIDVAVSFAAITSMPAEVAAAYLRDIHRVLRPEGRLRLQLYLGRPQLVRRTDTLHLRCYRQEHFERAAELAGFEVEWIDELILPFQVSFENLGILAVVAALKRSPRQPAPAAVISEALLPEGESAETEIVEGQDLEYWMTVNYAKELADQGQWLEAQETLEYAQSFNMTASIDVQDLMQRILQKLDSAPQQPAAGGTEPRNDNWSVLQQRFPDVHTLISSLPPAGEELSIRETEQGPVLYWHRQCLDHAQKPEDAGRAWAKRTQSESRLNSAEHLVVFGFGAGYHITELLRSGRQRISVIEPSAECFRAALNSRDLTDCLQRIEKLSVGGGDLSEFFDSECELALRPQTQVKSLQYWNEVRSRFYGSRGLSALSPKFAVLGPLYGGTLPIMAYTSHALALEQQRVREIDVSGFASGWQATESLLSNELLRAKVHSDYVNTVSQTVLASLTEAPVDILICMAQAPIVPETLTELRKRGIITVLWFVEDFRRFTSWRNLAPYFDFIFTIQRGECIEAIKGAGCPEVHYLPTAADPLIHQPLQLSPAEHQRWGSPISFVGAGYHNRQQMFASLAQLPFKIWGTEWPGCRPFDRLVQEEGRRLTPDEYVRIFNSTDININLHSSTERDGIDPSGDFLNPRTFELAAAGAFQLVDPRQLLNEVFTPGEDIVTFDSTSDLKEKIAYYLAHPEERRKIAERARNTVLAGHTYQHRIKELLSTVYARRYEQLKSRADRDPWKRMIERTERFPELNQRCRAAYERGEEPSLDALIAGVVAGQGTLTDTEQKLLFLFHVSKQIIRMKKEERGDKGG